MPHVNMSNRQLVAWMFSFLKPVKLLCFLACLYLCISIVVEIFTTRQMGETITGIKLLHLAAGYQSFWAWLSGPDPQVRHLRHVMAGLAALTLGFLVLRYVREVTNAKLSMTMVYYIREAVYDKLQRVGFGFHDQISTGQLINRALTDLQNVRTFIQTAVLITLDIVLVVGGYMILLATRNIWVAALSLVPLPFWVWYILNFGRKVQPASQQVMESEDRNVSLITENIAGVHVVKAFATQSLEINKYNAHCDSYFGKVLYRIRLYANFTPVIRSIGTASHLSLYLVAALLIVRGKLQIGDLLILGTAMGQILGRLQQVAVISDQYQNAIVSSRRLVEVLLAKPTVPEKENATPLGEGASEVVFENVTFGYDPAKPILRNVSFRVRGGSVVAIVGPTGAGKTTLVSLIARFYDPQSGRILIDGVDVRDMTLSSLRTRIAFVFQETYLFSDTVEANIAYGRPHIRGGEIEAASRLAQAHEFIEKMPKGYRTILTERGSSLSGGQKQRLAIARAILFNPRILVLDDATAAVDPETEDQIRRGLGHVLSDRTTFLIAHRISSVKRADVVIVIERGRITQMGTHDQLMAQEGHYRDIADAQLSGDDGRGADENPSHMKRSQNDREATAAAAAARLGRDADQGAEL